MMDDGSNCEFLLCDHCGRDLTPTGTILVDGTTKQGHWGTHCGPCWVKHGVGKFGTGTAQQYRRRFDGSLEKLNG